jgi:hypothetical protein
MSNPARRPTHRSPTARRGIPPPSHDPAYLSPAAAYSRPQDSIYYRERSDHIDLDLHFSSDLEDEDGDLEERGEEGGGAEDDEEGEAEGDGEGDEEVEEGEEEDSLSDTSSAEYDPDADPEGFAKRLDELAGLREVGVVEERAVRGGPALGLLSGEKAQRGMSLPALQACSDYETLGNTGQDPELIEQLHPLLYRSTNSGDTSPTTSTVQTGSIP